MLVTLRYKRVNGQSAFKRILIFAFKPWSKKKEEEPLCDDSSLLNYMVTGKAYENPGKFHKITH